MTTSAPESGNPISTSDVLSAVSSDHRRAVLRSLDQTAEETMEVSELTDRVAERVRSEEAQTVDHRQRVRTALHHIHLPKLESCGMIVYDTETKQVRKASTDLGEELLTAVESYETYE